MQLSVNKNFEQQNDCKNMFQFEKNFFGEISFGATTFKRTALSFSCSSSTVFVACRYAESRFAKCS